MFRGSRTGRVIALGLLGLSAGAWAQDPAGDGLPTTDRPQEGAPGALPEATADPLPEEAPALEAPLARPALWWRGLPVADVQLVAPRGGLPEESLEPLLRTLQAERLEPATLRLDLATLYRVGAFSAVEADVQPWFTYGPDGEPLPAVLVTFSVYPATRAMRVGISGTDELKQKVVREAADLDPGATYDPALDAAPLEARVRLAAVAAGFPDAVVAVEHTQREDGHVDVEIVVREGRARRVGSVTWSGEWPLSTRRVARIAGEEGVAPGAPFSLDAAQTAAYALREGLAGGGEPRVVAFLPWSPLLRERRLGWASARVGVATQARPDGDVDVTFTVEPGALLTLRVDGLPWRGPRKAREALGIDERLRLTRGFVGDAPSRLTDALQRDGYLAATADVELIASEGAQTLAIRVQRGPRHALRSPWTAPADSELHGLAFSGNEGLKDWQLRTVMTQASPEVLRAGHVTPAELDAGLRAVRDLYRAEGWTTATVTAGALQTTERRSFLSLPGVRGVAGRAFGVSPPRWVTVPITVEEGPRSALASLRITQAAPEVDLTAELAAAAAAAGGPYSPQRTERLARAVVDAHRRAGWLEADARVVSVPGSDGRFTSEIVVQPGPRVLLRSVVTQGARHVRSEVLNREIALRLGEPLTSTELQRVRDDLDALGLFRTVETRLIGDEAARDLVITVEERARNASELGVGVSSDRGARVFARYTRRNVLGRAHRADLNSFVGLQDLRADAFELRAAASYTAPRLLFGEHQLTADLLLQERLVERNFELARTGMGVYVDARVASRTQVRGGVRLELRRLIDADPGVILEGEPWAKLLADGGTWRPQHVVSAVVVQDLRDDPIRPTRGALLSLKADYVPTLGADSAWAVSFARVDLRARGYVPVGGLTLRLSGEAGFAQLLSGEALPLEDRYRLGGTASVRGFQRDAIGPRAEVAPPDIAWPTQLDPAISAYHAENPTRWVAVGGDVAASGTAELLLPLPALGLSGWDGYAGALFADVGNVWLRNGDVASESPAASAIFSPAVRYGVGAGLRVDTPVGPLQLDVATNPAAAFAMDPAKRERLREDWAEPALRAHLALGTLF